MAESLQSEKPIYNPLQVPACRGFFVSGLIIIL
jgi:hypothetical protein